MTSPYNTIAKVLSFTHRFDRWTRKEFAEGTGLSRSSVELMVAALRQQKVVYVDDWLDDAGGRQTIAVFAVGNRPDAKRRPKLTGVQRTRAYAARKKARAAGALALAMAAMTRQTETEEV